MGREGERIYSKGAAEEEAGEDGEAKNETEYENGSLDIYKAVSVRIKPSN